ncbi:helix-turn-helix domain-containing protein [Thalassotalea sediminis]|uniref:helix-turn-helix domain-containing protein n=1 Tax=Thalassotalea sediminis TaxID=1759089 RepID=UPI00257221DB|nr:helix-turn-helix domain-containing protein [Thalassotalea sediminis]
MKRTTYLSYQDKCFPLQHFATPIIDVCSARYVDQQKLLRGTGIFKSDIVEGRNASAKQLLQLLQQAKDLTPGYDCAFQIGHQLATNQQNSVMQAIQYSRNIEEFFRLILVFKHIFSPFIGATFIKEENWGYFLLEQKFGKTKLTPFITEIFSTALVSLCHQLLGRKICFHFGFDWQQPRYIQEYEENLGFQIKFSQPCAFFALELANLGYQNQHRNDLRKWHAIHKAKKEYSSTPTLLELIRQQLKMSPEMTMADLAQQLATSPATIKRKLREHGVSYTQLHQEVRKHLAIECLLVRGLNSEQSASILAISDPTNFRRAIKKWTGYTPSKLKQAYSITPTGEAPLT